jgi:kynurenine formamidase
MRTKALVVGYVLALALFLFAQRHPNVAQPMDFHAVVDLTASSDAAPTALHHVDYSYQNGGRLSSGRRFETRIDAPATMAAGLWTVDQIPPERLIAPLVVLDVRNSAQKNPDYQLSVMDIANWERAHGEIPLGSVVMALTGSTAKDNDLGSDRTTHSAGYSADAAKFLIEGRNVVGLGIDSHSVDSGLQKDGPVYKYTLSRDAYLLENVADLELAPADGGIVMVAPPKMENRTNAPVRILALAR